MVAAVLFCVYDLLCPALPVCLSVVGVVGTPFRWEHPFPDLLQVSNRGEMRGTAATFKPVPFRHKLNSQEELCH